jgi:hypothetical protein
VRRDPEANPLGEVRPHPLPRRLEPLGELAPVAEHLEVDDRAQPQLRTRDGRRAAEARVRDGGHPRAQALRGARARDRDVLVPADASLALDVDEDPLAEVEPVPEAAVRRVLEVGVRVDEPRHDRRALEVPAAAQLRRRPHRRDPPVLHDDGAVADRLALDREHPVGREHGRR